MINKDMSILIVDDFGSMRSQIRAILKLMGFENVVEARNGNEAKPILDKEKVGFIISDWMMPECDGLSFLRYVREHEVHKDTPFLMVTAMSDKKAVIDAVAAKVNNYIVKPFTAETLEMKMRAVFGCAEPLWSKSKGL